MRSSLFRYTFLLLFVAAFLTSCKDDDAIPAMSKEEALTSKTWQGEAVFLAGTNVTENSQLLSPLPDVRTLSVDFNVNGTYTAYYTENGVPLEREGEWEFRENEQVLYFDLLPTYRLTIAELNETHLKLNTTVSNPGGLTVPAEVHFRAMP